MGYVQIPGSGRLGSAESPTGAALRGRPGWLVSSSDGSASPDLDTLLEAAYQIGGPDISTNAYLVGSEATEIAGFDTTRMSCEIYCDDSSPDPVYIGGPQVAPVSGQTQPNAGIRLNPGSGRIYDGADRAKRIFAICASGQTAVVVVATTGTSNQG